MSQPPPQKKYPKTHLICRYFLGLFFYSLFSKIWSMRKCSMISFIIKNMSFSFKLITWSFYIRQFRTIKSFMVSWLRIDVRFFTRIFVGKIFIKISLQICMQCNSYRMHSYLFACYMTFFLYISKKSTVKLLFVIYSLFIFTSALWRPNEYPKLFTQSYESTLIYAEISCPLSDCYDNFIPTSELKH